MTSEYRLLEVDWLKNMWRPDSFFKNAKSVTFQTMTIPNHYVWLYKDKTILYMVKLTLKLSCAMNFVIYPHDTQECKLQMESCKWNLIDFFLLSMLCAVCLFWTSIWCLACIWCLLMSSSCCCSLQTSVLTNAWFTIKIGRFFCLQYLTRLTIWSSSGIPRCRSLSAMR